MVMLESNGITSSKKMVKTAQEESWTVTVDENDYENSLMLMQQNELPQEPKQGFKSLYSQKGLVPTALEERALYLDALSNELANSLMMIDGIVDARVHLVLPESVNAGLFNQNNPSIPSASVLVKHLEQNKNVIEDDSIRKLICGAVPQMQAANVAVIRTIQPVANKMMPHETSQQSNSMNRYKAVAVLGLTVSLILGCLIVATGFKLKKMKQRLCDVSRSELAQSQKQGIQ